MESRVERCVYIDVAVNHKHVTDMPNVDRICIRADRIMSIVSPAGSTGACVIYLEHDYAYRMPYTSITSIRGQGVYYIECKESYDSVMEKLSGVGMMFNGDYTARTGKRRL